MHTSTGTSADTLSEPGRSSKRANPLNTVHFGEQHLHTQDSPDAFAIGTRNTQDDAYDFCKGKIIKNLTLGEPGMMVQKKTPYDWCAVTDHALLMGLLLNTRDSSSPLSNTEVAKLIKTGKPEDMDKAFGIMMAAIQKGGPPAGCDNKELQRSAWANQKQVTNKHNASGEFTTLIVFEWTSIPYARTCIATSSSGTTRAPKWSPRPGTRIGPRMCEPIWRCNVVLVTRYLRLRTISTSVMAGGIHDSHCS